MVGLVLFVTQRGVNIVDQNLHNAINLNNKSDLNNLKSTLNNLTIKLLYDKDQKPKRNKSYLKANQNILNFDSNQRNTFNGLKKDLIANLNNKKEAILYAKKIGTLNTGSENFIVALAYDQLEIIDQVIKHLKIAIDKNYPLEEIINTPLIKFSREFDQFNILISKN